MQAVGRLGVAAVVVGWMASGCGAGDDAGEVGSPRCDESSPTFAVDGDTTGGDGPIQVYVATGGGDIKRITGDWVASQPSFSPDGDKVVVVRAEGDYQSSGPDKTTLWTMGVDGSNSSQVTTGDVLDDAPDWSPDGSSIAFTRTWLEQGDYSTSIAAVPVEGGEPKHLVTVEGDTKLEEPVWSPDGKQIAFIRLEYSASDSTQLTTVWTMSADGSNVRQLVEGLYADTLDWSPDGKSLLLSGTAADEGAHQVDVASADARLVGPGVELASWSPDGDVYFLQRIEGPDVRGGSEWELRVGHIEDGTLVNDGALPQPDSTFYPSFVVAAAPCG